MVEARIENEQISEKISQSLSLPSDEEISNSSEIYTNSDNNRICELLKYGFSCFLYTKSYAIVCTQFNDIKFQIEEAYKPQSILPEITIIKGLYNIDDIPLEIILNIYRGDYSLEEWVSCNIIYNKKDLILPFNDNEKRIFEMKCGFKLMKDFRCSSYDKEETKKNCKRLGSQYKTFGMSNQPKLDTKPYIM